MAGFISIFDIISLLYLFIFIYFLKKELKFKINFYKIIIKNPLKKNVFKYVMT